MACAQQFIVAPTVEIALPGANALSADFNRDGNPDLMVIGTSLTILLGRGDGTFVPGQVWPDVNATAVVIGDWDRDGIPDLAAALPGSVQIYPGIGDGTFRQGYYYGLSSGPRSLAAGDMNGDGILDLVTGDYQGTVSVLLGKGRGTFQAPVDYKLPQNTEVDGLVAADFNGDGTIDIAASELNDSVAVLLGNGDGTLRSVVEYPAGTVYVYQLASSDFNHDGIPDLVTAGINDIAVLLGKGDGTFLPTQTYGQLPCCRALRIADLNEDGNPDVLGVNDYYNPPAMAVYYGNADGTFQPSVFYATGTGSPYTMAVADFNKDGHLDAAVLEDVYFSTAFTLFLGQPGATLLAARYFSLADDNQVNSPYLTSLALGYLNADKNLDVAALDTNYGRVLVTLGQPDGTFHGHRGFPTGRGASTIALADLNKDGKADVITDNNKGISVLIGDGSGNFAPHVDYTGSSASQFVATGDVNGDGNIDAITVGARSVNVFLNDGSGQFPTHVDTTMLNEPFQVAAGDFNQDGKLDLVTANRGTAHAASVLLGNGDGNFTPAETFAVRRSVFGVGSVAVADMNSDGKLDFVLVSSGAVWVFLGKGDGTFEDPRETAGVCTGNPTPTCELYLSSMRIGDINRDGKLDIMGSSVYLLLGRGDGTFDVQSVTDAGGGAAEGLGDFNHDGALDVVVGAGETILVLLNTGQQKATPNFHTIP